MKNSGRLKEIFQTAFCCISRSILSDHQLDFRCFCQPFGRQGHGVAAFFTGQHPAFFNQQIGYTLFHQIAPIELLVGFRFGQHQQQAVACITPHRVRGYATHSTDGSTLADFRCSKRSPHHPPTACVSAPYPLVSQGLAISKALPVRQVSKP